VSTDVILYEGLLNLKIRHMIVIRVLILWMFQLSDHCFLCYNLIGCNTIEAVGSDKYINTTHLKRDMSFN
jgi:hypothetical protein